MGPYIPRFNPQKMEDKDVLMLATGREKVLELMLNEMENCLKINGNQQFILYGPRGIGKSFFTQLLKVSHDQSQKFSKSIFIQFPEEQNNITFVADIMDMLSAKLEGKNFSSVSTRWEINDQSWNLSKKRLLTALENLKKWRGKYHVFFAMENLQDFIPKLDDIENARMREFLTDFDDITLIGSSLRPDMDNNYNKKLFQAFKKIQLEPWTEQNFVDYYLKQTKSMGISVEKNGVKNVSEQKIRAIAKFSGGSPRIAVILNSLILDDDLISTIDIMNGVIDELTPYYQDLTKDIPQRSKTLFDLLIRLNENITQSELASKLNPPQDQSTIARSFNWLIENYYVTSIKQKKANVKNYYVRDRLFVLYYQTREVMSDQKNSFIQTLIEFLTEFYTVNELTYKINKLNLESKWGKQLKAGLSEILTKASLSEILTKANIEFKTFKDLQNDVLLARIDVLQNLYLSGKYDEYIEIYETLEKSNLSPGEYLMAGSSYSNKNFTEKAIDAYIRGLAVASKHNLSLDFKVYFNLGNLFSKVENLAEALLYYYKSINLNQRFSSGYFNIAIIYGKQKKYEKAIEYYYKAIGIEPDDSELYFNLGIVLGSIEKYNEAIGVLKKAIVLNPENHEIYFNIAYCYEKIDDLKNAEENYLIAINLDKNDIDSYINLGALYHNLKQFEKSIDIYKQIIEIDPNNASAYVGIGFGYSSLNNFEKSLISYKKALEINPYHYFANLNTSALFLDMGLPEQSIEYCFKCIVINSNDSDVYNILGCAYYELNQFEKAEEKYLVALAIDNKNEFANSNLIQLYLKIENFEKIKGLLENGNKYSLNMKILSKELVKIFTKERTNDFNKFLKVYHFINEFNPNLLLEFFSTLSSEIYKEKLLDLLQDVLDEFKTTNKIDDSIKILIETWEYILNPIEKDLVSLHPDVRLTAEGILESLK